MLSHVTFTGWDDRTNIGDLGLLCRDQRPASIEIAVLLSLDRVGEDRYPGIESATEILRTAKYAGQRIAVHACGRAARELLLHHTLGPELRPLLEAAERVQVNVPETLWDDARPRYRFAHELAAAIERPVIVQVRDPEGWPERVEGVQYLFDRSAGRGQVAEQVPPLTTFSVGYAGGLGPDNAHTFLDKLRPMSRVQPIAPIAPIWIDMKNGIRETSPRTKMDIPPWSYVSVTKCAQVMDAVRWALM